MQRMLRSLGRALATGTVMFAGFAACNSGGDDPAESDERTAEAVKPPPKVANCLPGYTKCRGICVDLLTNTNNCGACATVCSAGTCTGGSCCPTGQTGCSGSCVALDSDTANCGACGVACGDGALCTTGHCVCPTGHSVCNGACVDLDSDNANCGTCGNVCPSNRTCLSGFCF